MREAVIVDCMRTAVGKAPRGALRHSRPDDLAATVFQLLGIDPTTEVMDALNRPLPISSGSPVAGVMA